MSANGSVAGFPPTASWNAFSTSSSDSDSTIVPPCTAGSNDGCAVNTGSLSSARLILTVPLRVCQCSMSAAKPAGSSARSSSRRNEIAGCAVVTTQEASISSPLASVTPATAPSRTRIRPTSASVLTVAPNPRAAAAMAAATAPIPPRGNPQAPDCPPASPTWWCSITYAVPALRGPAQVPMTPDTDSTPRSASLSKYRSSRSAIDPVNSRVMSTAPRTSTARSRAASRACASRSAGRRDPSRGGTCSSSGATTRAMPARCASYAS